MDWNHLATLLLVEEKTRGHPTLKVLHDQAMAELQSEALSASQPQEPQEPQPEEFPDFGRREDEHAA